MVIIPGDQPGKGIDFYGGKDFEKGKVLRGEWKTPRVARFTLIECTRPTTSSYCSVYSPVKLLKVWRFELQELKGLSSVGQKTLKFTDFKV